MKPPIKILFIHPTVYLNGVSRGLADMINGLDGDAFRVFVAVPEASALERLITRSDVAIEYVKMTNLGRRPGRLLGHIVHHRRETQHLAELGRRVEADVLYGNTLFASWAYEAARQIQRPCVIHVHEGPASFPGFLYRRWVRQAGRSAQLILVVSEEISHEFREFSEKVACVENGLDLERFHSAIAPARSPASCGDELRLLCVSHLMEGKGQHELIAQLPEVKKRCPGARVTFVGGTNGVPRNERYLERLQREAQKLGVAGRLRFAGPQLDLLPWFESCDVFVNTSPYETFGLTLLEALSASVPVVTRRVGVAGQMERENMPGLHVIQNSWNELPETIERIDREGFSGLISARAPLLRRYGVQEHVRRVEDLILRLLD
ncbi:MAG: glycosyltransferase family 4 protein [Acidobacteriia bacterium]|nr:glycosyltransferase family 4 protein [Terriglobia bacterium]